MRQSVILLNLMAGLWLMVGHSQLSTALSPTINTCYICDEEIIPAVLPTPTATQAAKKGKAVVHAVML